MKVPEELNRIADVVLNYRHDPKCTTASPLDFPCPTCKEPPGMPCRMSRLAMTPRNAAKGTNQAHTSRVNRAKKGKR